MRKKNSRKFIELTASFIIIISLIMSSFVASSFSASLGNGPTIKNINENPDPQKIGGYVNISCNVTDPDYVDEVFLNIKDPNNIVQNFSIKSNNTGNIYYCNQTYDIAGQYKYFIWANDTNGDATISSIHSFTIIRWNVVLNVSVSSGKYDTAIFGEVDNASEGQDNYDVPKPPVPDEPYVYAYFDANLSEPWDKLWADYRGYPDTSKIWDLYIICNTTIPSIGDTVINITWNSEEINDTEYDFIELWNESEFLKDLNIGDEYYIFDADFDTLYHFQIKCTINQAPVVGDIPNQTVVEGGSFSTILLDDYVIDVEDPDSSIVWTYSGNTSLTVNIIDRIATIGISNPDWFGSETITFRATDTGGLWDEDNATFTVTAVNDPPVADFIYSPSYPSIVDIITFSSTSIDIDGVIINWTWDFGDGNFSYSENTSHQYTIAGLYTVNLTVKDNGSLVSFIEKNVFVSLVSWEVWLNIVGPNGINDSILFGESSSASDGQDAFDVPKPVMPPAPHIYAWFDANLTQPYDKLWMDYRYYPDTQKTWDMYVLWEDSSSANLTLSWDSANFSGCEYDVILLRDVIADIEVDMFEFSNYTYLASSFVVRHFEIVCSLVPEVFNYSVALSAKWNLVSLPVNKSVDKVDVVVEYLGVNYSWDDAVSSGILVGFVYGWNVSYQNYVIVDVFEPGCGYWLYAYSSCKLWVSSNVSFDDDFISFLSVKWNLVGLPFNESVVVDNLTVWYNGSLYSWDDAVSSGIVLGFVYGWNVSFQNYVIVDTLYSGCGYWLYAYYNCILKREVI